MKNARTWFLLVALLIPSARGAGDLTVAVTVSVPDGGWRVSIREVYRVKNELWAVSRLSREAGMAIQVISKVSDSVSVSSGPLPVKHFLLGKTWKWKNSEPYEFPPDRKTLDAKLKGAKLLFKKK